LALETFPAGAWPAQPEACSHPWPLSRCPACRVSASQYMDFPAICQCLHLGSDASHLAGDCSPNL